MINYTENTILSMEERILLASFEETDSKKCVEAIDRLSMTIPLTDEMFPILMDLRYKLRYGNVNIEKEIENIPDDEDITES